MHPTHDFNPCSSCTHTTITQAMGIARSKGPKNINFPSKRLIARKRIQQILILENDVPVVELTKLNHVSAVCKTEHKKFSNLQGMNDTWNITKYREEYVNQQVCVAATFKEDANRREEDGENDLANVTMDGIKLAQS